MRAQDGILIEKGALDLANIEITHRTGRSAGQRRRHAGRMPDRHAGPGPSERGLSEMIARNTASGDDHVVDVLGHQ